MREKTEADPRGAADENRARRRAGKGGKGQRAAQEGEKGKLRLGGRPRRSGAETAGGQKGGKRRERGAPADPDRRGIAGAERRRLRPGPSSRCREKTLREVGEPRGNCPRPGRTWRPTRRPSAPPRHVRALTSSQLGRSGDPVPSVQIVSPRPPRRTDPDPNPRQGRPAPPESHCACVIRHAPRLLLMPLPPQ